MSNSAEKRIVNQNAKKGMNTADILLIAILLAVGIVLKLFSNTLFGWTPMKPNFVIAMYCLAILVVRPKLYEASIIGLLAGILCQFLPGTTPYANIVSEAIGATVMFLLLALPVDVAIKKYSFKPAIATFISTLFSGYSFFAAMRLLILVGTLGQSKLTLVVFTSIIFGTAAVNAVIVQLLYTPISLAFKKK